MILVLLLYQVCRQLLQLYQIQLKPWTGPLTSFCYRASKYIFVYPYSSIDHLSVKLVVKSNTGAYYFRSNKSSTIRSSEILLPFIIESSSVIYYLNSGFSKILRVSSILRANFLFPSSYLFHCILTMNSNIRFILLVFCTSCLPALSLFLTIIRISSFEKNTLRRR